MRITGILNPAAVLLAAALSLPPPLQGGWTRQFSGTTVRLTDVRMLDSLSAVAVGYGRTIIKTTDLGQTWVKMLSLGANLNAVAFADPLLGAAAGDSRTLLFTSDGGENWAPAFIAGTGNFLSVAFAGSRVVMVGTDAGRVLVSGDTGATWTERNLSAFPIYDLFIARGTVDVSFTAFAVASNAVYKSTDDGAMWTAAPLPLTPAGIALQGACAPGGICYAVGYDAGDLPYSRIMRRIPADTGWTTYPFPQPSPPIVVRGVTTASPSVAYACGSSGLIWRTVDGGASWVTAPSGTTRRLNAVSFARPERGFAVGDSGTVLFTDDGTTAVFDRSRPLPQEVLLLRNYPNPFNAGTLITYRLSAAGLVRLTVSDLLGRYVAVLVNSVLPAGEHTVTWNPAGLSSGMYLLRLTAGGSSATGRALLLR